MGGIDGMHSMGASKTSVTGGAYERCNARHHFAGNALSSTDTGDPMKGPLLSTNPAIDREEAKVGRTNNSTCTGC